MVLTWPVRNRDTDQNGGARGPSRRALLRAGAVAAVSAVAATTLTGCDLFGGDGSKRGAADPLAPLITGALDLAARHEATVASQPELADRLNPIAQAHRAHATELARVTGTTLPSGPATPPASPAGDDAKGSLAALRAAEQQGHEAAAKACAGAPEKRAALVGSIAAARASHAEALR
jgi:hypothetical protein